MALSDTERKILVAAREAIKNRGFFFVCEAIDGCEVVGTDPHMVRAAKIRLRNYIQSSLGSNRTLGGWLSKRHGNRWLDMSRLQRACRVEWITWMLGDEPKFAPDVWSEIQKNMTLPDHIKP